jgi:nonsense-mediated mRNA decay protein 3
MICVECGNESEIINNGLCINCYIKSKNFTKGPEFYNIIKCSNCNAYKLKNKWENQSLNNIIDRYITQIFKISDELKKPEIKIIFKDDDNQYKKQLEIAIRGFISNLEVIEKHSIQINVKKEICDTCSKQFGGYHEAIIQIRADKRSLTIEEIDGIYAFVKEYIEIMQNKGNKNIFLADFEIKENGINFFISDNNIALSITKKLQELYVGNITKSSKNIGMKDGRQIYRMTYLLRLFQYNEGDILSHKEKFYYVKKIFRNKIYLIDLEQWSENIFNNKELSKFLIKGKNDLVKNMILVSQTNDEVQLMDQKNYNIYFIKKPKKISFNNDFIEIIQIQDRIFLSPNLDK